MFLYAICFMLISGASPPSLGAGRFSIKTGIWSEIHPILLPYCCDENSFSIFHIWRFNTLRFKIIDRLPLDLGLYVTLTLTLLTQKPPS